MGTAISQLSGTFTSYAAGNLMVVVDVTDTSMAATGTDKRITVGSFLSSYSIVSLPGSASLTTLGTVTTGTWAATAIAPSYLTAMGASGASHSAGIVPDPGATPGTTRYLREDATWQVVTSNPGTVTSVGLSLPGIFSVSGSPVTSSGTLTGTLVNQSANQVFAGPATGAAASPTFRVLVQADIPSITSTGSTTARLLADRFAEVFNVKDYGAVGDGSTNDLAAIQSAIAAASSAGGGTVYFPAATYSIKPTTTTWINLASNVNLRGESRSILKIDPTTGNFKTILGQASSGVNISNIEIRGLWFDQNPSGNTGANLTIGVVTTNQFVVYLNNVTNLRVIDCQFDRCTGVNTVACSGSTTIEDVQLVNCRFYFTQAATTSPDYDNSAVYLDGKTMRVSGCRFYSPISQHGRGCVELHGGQASMVGNVSDGYQTLVNIVSQTNVGGSVRQNNDITVVGNAVSSANWGIQFWPLASSVLRNVTVSGNTISLDQVTHNENTCAGIWFNSSTGITGTLENIIISDNAIEFNSTDTNRSIDRKGNALTANLIFGIGLEGLTGGNGIVVSGNAVRNSPATGIKVGDTGLTYTDVRVVDNLVVDSGINAALANSYRMAFFFAGTLAQVRVDRNQIYDSGAAALNGYGYIYYHPAAATDCSFWSNLWSSASGLALTKDIDGTKELDSDDLISYFTQDRTTNYQRFRGFWANNTTYTLTSESAGTGSTTVVQLQSKTAAGAVSNIQIQANALPFIRLLTSNAAISATPFFQCTGTLTGASAGTQTMFGVEPTINQSSTAGYTAFRVNPTQTVTGSGTKLIMDLQLGSSSLWAVDTGGNIVVNATNGIKIGTATTQKLGFYNATPIVQPTGDILVALGNLGLVGSPTIPLTELGTGTPGSTNFLRGDGTWNTAVTSVTFTGDGTVLSSTPSSAVTTSGTVAASLLTQSANKVLAGPTTGSAVAPTFRSLVANDIPGTLNPTTIAAGSDVAVAIIKANSTQTHDLLTIESSTPTVQGGVNSNYNLYGSVAPDVITGRLCLDSADPRKNVANGTTLYYLPVGGRGCITLYNTTSGQYEDWLFGTSGLSLSLTGLTANTLYDITVYNNSGTLTLETTAWTSSGAGTSDRATTLTGAGDYWYLTGSQGHRYLGTIYTSSTGTTQDVAATRYVWNMYNQISKPIFSTFTGSPDPWTLSNGSTTGSLIWSTLGPSNNTAVSFCSGFVTTMCAIITATLKIAATTGTAYLGIHINNTTAPLSYLGWGITSNGPVTQPLFANTGSTNAGAKNGGYQVVNGFGGINSSTTSNTASFYGPINVTGYFPC